jgi:hypothetical protein
VTHSKHPPPQNVLDQELVTVLPIGQVGSKRVSRRVGGLGLKQVRRRDRGEALDG